MSGGTDIFEETILDKAIKFQNGIIAHSTGASFDGGDAAYIRQEVH